MPASLPPATDARQTLRIVGYIRVSTDEQASSGLGLEGQAAALRRACDYRQWELVEIITDEGVSGSTLHRPGLRHALEMIVTDELADGLIVAKLDRLTRSMRDFCELVDFFEDAGVSLVMLDPEVDTSAAQGRAMAQVMVAFAELERRMIGDRTKVALAAKRARGESIGRPAIVDRPELAARILQMREQHGMTLQAIADQLTAEGVPTARGAALWRASSVQAAAGYERPAARRQRAGLPAIPTRQRRHSPTKGH